MKTESANPKTWSAGRLLPFLLLAAVVLAPLILRPRTQSPAPGERQLVIITPNNEAIRFEFERAFAEQHLAKTGEKIRVDWRAVGGTSDCVRYLDSEFLAGFENYWKTTLGKPWSGAVERSFANAKIEPGANAVADTPEQAARRAFLDSKIGCGIDLFFGGGSLDFAKEANEGRLVDCGLVAAHPELFGPGAIPAKLAGEALWDPKGRWLGVCLAAFGICSNSDALTRLGISAAPRRWDDLADPRYFHEVALANPAQSGSITRAFELLIQQQMIEETARQTAAAGGEKLTAEQQAAAIRTGWQSAMQSLLKIGANARYFTDSSTKISLDVASGDAAAGMTIDFYGRFESEAVRQPDGSSRIQFYEAEGGTSFSPDPIGLLRGAPNADLGREFIAWAFSPEGQKLWCWKLGAPGGPQRYALRRLPVLPALYGAEFKADRSDPEVNPYVEAVRFSYHPEWTGPLFRPIAFIVRVMCVDTHDELASAWHALIEAGFPPQATAAFLDVSAVDYATAGGEIKGTLGENKIAEVHLAKTLADHFRAQYRTTETLAKAGK